jgi:hypothetical protein
VNPLKVSEAYTRDVGRGVARIDYDAMDALGVSTGDVIEIEGKRKTTAICLPLYPSDEGKEIIRIDGLVRNNSETTIDDTIQYRKIKATPAYSVVIVPLEEIPPIDEGYLADALENVPVIKGDSVRVPYFGGRLTFQVIGFTPSTDAVIITKKTDVRIAEKGDTSNKNLQVVSKDNEKSTDEIDTSHMSENPLKKFQHALTLEREQKYLQSLDVLLEVEDILEQSKFEGIDLWDVKIKIPILHSKMGNDQKVLTRIFTYCNSSNTYTIDEKMKILKLIQTEKEFKKFHKNADFQNSIHILKSIEPESEPFEEIVEESTYETVEESVDETVEESVDETVEESEDRIIPQNLGSWAYDCLEDAKYIIRKHHTDYDTAEFFANTTYKLFSQTDREDAYGYIRIEPNSNHFNIGIHQTLVEQNPQNERMVTIVLVHELLHAIHDREGWEHDKIIPLEQKLANLAGYFDALIEMEKLALSGRMRICGE